MAREGQPLRWVTVEELDSLALLEADGPIVDALRALNRGRAGSERPG